MNSIIFAAAIDLHKTMAASEDVVIAKDGKERVRWRFPADPNYIETYRSLDKRRKVAGQLRWCVGLMLSGGVGVVYGPVKAYCMQEEGKGRWTKKLKLKLN